MLETNKIYCINNVDGMRQLDDESVDLTVTSPPYDKQRTYNGFEWDFESVAKHLYRITKNNGVLVWVVSDETKDFKESLTSFKQAIYFTECGFGLLDTMIYHKLNIPPAYPTMRRYAQCFEYMFVFSKGKPKTFNPIETEKIHPITNYKTRFRQKDGSFKEMNKTSEIKPKKINNLWSICSRGSHKDIGHPAIFPEELAEKHIRTWSNEGDIILDPFIGSGTTAVVAKRMNRQYIGFEISKKYCLIAEKRLCINR